MLASEVLSRITVRRQSVPLSEIGRALEGPLNKREIRPSRNPGRFELWGAHWLIPIEGKRGDGPETALSCVTLASAGISPHFSNPGAEFAQTGV